MWPHLESHIRKAIEKLPRSMPEEETSVDVVVYMTIKTCSSPPPRSKSASTYPKDFLAPEPTI